MTSKKAAPPWRAVFLRALGRCGTVRVSAREAGVQAGRAYQERLCDARFAARWRAALVRAAERLGGAGKRGVGAPAMALLDPTERGGAGGGRAAPRKARKGSGGGGKAKKRSGGGKGGGKGGGFRAGELVARGSGARVQLVRAAEGRWSARTEAAFLAEIEATANAQAAARACGLSASGLYRRRRGDPGFAARWDAAKAAARERIDLMLVQAALAALDPDIEGPEGLPKVTVAEAITILRLGAKSGAGAGARGLRVKTPPSIEAVRDEVLRRIAAMRRGREEAARRLGLGGDAEAPGGEGCPETDGEADGPETDGEAEG
jgi:hypothetical protein